VRGVSLFGRFSDDMGLHVMSVPPSTRATIRANSVMGAVAPRRVVELQGAMRFAAAERVAREFALEDIDERHVVLDLTLVSSIDDVAQRMLIELADRLVDGGHDVTLVDPDARMQGGFRGEASRVRRVSLWSDDVAANISS
jgi:glutaminase